MGPPALPSKFDELRRQAEEMLHERGEGTIESRGMDILSLIHELEVHQIELQIQNEELRQAHREADDALRAYADLFEFAPTGYLTTNEKGIISRANGMASELLHTPKDTVKGFVITDFIHPEDRGVYFKIIREGIGKKGVKRTGEIRFLRAKIMPFWVHVDIVPFLDGGGQLIGWRIGFADVSDRMRYAEELERSNRELQDFAFIASHDLQEPLRKIKTFGDMLVRKYTDILPDEGRDYLTRVINAANRMSELLQSLLRYSRVATQANPFAQADLNAIAKDAVSDLEVTIIKAGATVDVGELPSIEADGPQMRQLFQNLISNSIKYCRKGERPVVKITGSSNGEMCQLLFQDNGIGFEEQYLDRIFKPFQRLHGRGAGYEGTGMGLAICRKIVGRHGGTITAETTPGKGATFIVNLPVKHNIAKSAITGQ